RSPPWTERVESPAAAFAEPRSVRRSLMGRFFFRGALSSSSGSARGPASAEIARRGWRPAYGRPWGASTDAPRALLLHVRASGPRSIKARSLPAAPAAARRLGPGRRLEPARLDLRAVHARASRRDGPVRPDLRHGAARRRAG